MSVTDVGASRRVRRGGNPARAAREVLVLMGLYLGYTLSRLVAADDLGPARSRAEDIENLEDALHLDLELWLNQVTSATAWVAVPMDYWYCALHYLVTPAVLGWMYLRRAGTYTRVRNALVTSSGLGLICYLAVPTAPPRLVGGPYADTLAQYANFGWWAEHASAPSGLGNFTNELAAMPSLHVGWAVWVAWALSRNTWSRWRSLLLYLYPLGTAVVVVGTGNHWLLDAVMGLLVSLIGICVAGALERRVPELPTAPPSPDGTTVNDHPALMCEVTVSRRVPAAVLGSLRQRFEYVSLTLDGMRLVVSAPDQSAVRGLVNFLWDVGLEVRSMTSAVHLS